MHWHDTSTLPPTHLLLSLGVPLSHPHPVAALLHAWWPRLQTSESLWMRQRPGSCSHGSFTCPRCINKQKPNLTGLRDGMTVLKAPAVPAARQSITLALARAAVVLAGMTQQRRVGAAAMRR